MKIPNVAGSHLWRGLSLARIVSEDSQQKTGVFHTGTKSSKDS